MERNPQQQKQGDCRAHKDDQETLTFRHTFPPQSDSPRVGVRLNQKRLIES